MCVCVCVSKRCPLPSAALCFYVVLAFTLRDETTLDTLNPPWQTYNV